MPLDPRTPLARFLFSSGEVNASGRVMSSGFMPHWNAGSGRFELSVFDVAALPAQTVFEIAREVEVSRSKPCKGWAVMPAEGYVAAGLDVEPDGVPPRHVNVVGWPPEKEGRKQRAQKVAAEFVERGGTFVRRP